MEIKLQSSMWKIKTSEKLNEAFGNHVNLRFGNSNTHVC